MEHLLIGASLLAMPEKLGGVDGARTRDPRRDRTEQKVNIHAGCRPIFIFQTSDHKFDFPEVKNWIYIGLFQSFFEELLNQIKIDFLQLMIET